MNNITHKLMLSGKAWAALSLQNPGFSISPTLLAMAIAQALAIPSTQAASIVVDNSSDAGTGCTLRDAVTSINAGNVGATGCINSGGAFGSDDQISFSIATVSLSNGELDINKSLTIDGGNSGVTINGDSSSRLLKLDAGGTSFSLNRLTLSGGYAYEGVYAEVYSGGAIYAKGVDLTLSNCTLSGNSAVYGGGIHAFSSSVNLSNSTVSGNFGFRGGAIHARDNSSVSLSNSTISGNSGFRGGAIYLRNSSSLSLSGSTVTNNSGFAFGGGISVRYSSSVSLDNSTVSRNSAGYGGGIEAYAGSSVSLTNSTLSGNSVTLGNGGGIHLRYNSSASLSNSNVMVNRSRFGSGIYAETSSLNLSSSTISENSGYAGAGGIAAFNSSMSISNSTITENFAPPYDGAGGIFAHYCRVSISGSTVSGNPGGGIYARSNSSVSLSNSTVSGNSGDHGFGGVSVIKSDVSINNSIVSQNLNRGITLNGGSTRISNSTVSGNSGYGDGDSRIISAYKSIVILSNSSVSGNLDGGIDASYSQVSLNNSTVSGNLGIGINTHHSGRVSLSNSTVSGNLDGGIDASYNARVDLSNSIIANSGGIDCVTTSPYRFTADSHNIIEDGSCETPTTDALSVDPKLGTLADNGGPTKTHALLTGSPAIDAGDNVVCAAAPVNNLDQRGETRPVGSACDIGSYEFGAGTGPGTPFSVAPLPDGKGGYFFISL